MSLTATQMCLIDSLYSSEGIITACELSFPACFGRHILAIWGPILFFKEAIHCKLGKEWFSYSILNFPSSRYTHVRFYFSWGVIYRLSESVFVIPTSIGYGDSKCSKSGVGNTGIKEKHHSKGFISAWKPKTMLESTVRLFETNTIDRSSKMLASRVRSSSEGRRDRRQGQCQKHSRSWSSADEFGKL